MESPFNKKKKETKTKPKKKEFKAKDPFKVEEGERLEVKGTSVVKIKDVMGKDKRGKEIILKSKSSYVGKVNKLKHLFPKWHKKGWLKKK